MDLKTIEIKFEYQEKIITIKSEAYITIKEIKEKAIKKFHDIPKDIHCFYLSRDLFPYESITVGDFFNNREKVTLKLMPKKKPIFPIKKRSLERNEKNFFSDIYVNTNVYSSGFNNIGRFQSKKNNKVYRSIDSEEIKYKNNNNNNNNDNNNINNNNNNNNNNKIKVKLPKIKNNIKSTLQKDTTILNNRYNLSNDEINNDDESLRCQNCPKNKFSEYCRNCKEFLCPDCKNEEKHQNHLFIHLDSNYESSVKIFGNILLTDIEHFKEQNKIINEKEDIINNYTSALNLNKLNEKYNTLFNKLKDILNMYESILNQIKEELILEGQNKTNELIDIYNEKSTKISDEINQILKQLEGHKEKLNLTEFMSYFEKMGKEEEKLNLINKNIIKIHLSSQINDKIYSIMNKIEQIMNETYGDENNLFNLSPNFNMELSGVLKRIKKKEFNENIVRPKKKTSKKRKSDYYHDFNEEE